MSKKLTLLEIKERYENKSLEIIGVERRQTKNGEVRTYVKYRCLIDLYEGWMPMSSLYSGRGCIKCGKRNMAKAITLSQEDVVSQFILTHGDKYLYDKVIYTGHDNKVLIGCKVEGHGYFNQRPSCHKRGTGCPKCSGREIYNNSLEDERPDLLKYLVNIEDGGKYSVKSNKKIQVKCPECDMIKTKKIPVNKLSSRVFSCEYCSDNISIPEKFCMQVLKRLGVYFETQKIFDWAKNKKYDFYIPSMNIIIETHGMQHYNQTTGHYKKTLKDEVSNDVLKFEKALLNNIELKDYIVIDCRYSDFDWLKTNFIKQLYLHFNLLNIEWDSIWEDCQSSLAVKVWNAWNNKSRDETTHDMSKKFRIGKNKVVSFLKNGDKIGKCKYDSKEEMRKNGSRNGKNTAKKVYKYTKDRVFIEEYASAKSASLLAGVCKETIGKCCRSGTLFDGYIYSYVKF